MELIYKTFKNITLLLNILFLLPILFILHITTKILKFIESFWKNN